MRVVYLFKEKESTTYFEIANVHCEKEYLDGGGMSDETLVLLDSIKMPCCSQFEANGFVSMDIGKKTAFFKGDHGWTNDLENEHTWNKLSKQFTSDGWKIEYNLIPYPHPIKSSKYDEFVKLWLR